MSTTMNATGTKGLGQDGQGQPEALTVTFWGVRGSIATPGPDTVEYGGNTSCVEVQAGGHTLIFDTGTGVRLLGQKLLRERASAERRGPLGAHIFYSHVHWDHIQGLPFFTPLFIPGTRLSFYGPKGDMPLGDVLRLQMSDPVFPVRLADLASQLSFTDLTDGARVALPRLDGGVGEVEITCARLNHPGGVLAYRVSCGGRAVVYATDTEHYSCPDPKLVRLCRDADLLIYDAMYDDDEYAGRRGAPRTGWGHSTFSEGIRIADAANVAKLVLFHHDPAHDDACVRAIEERASARRPGTIAAREGMSLHLTQRADLPGALDNHAATVAREGRREGVAA